MKRLIATVLLILAANSHIALPSQANEVVFLQKKFGNCTELKKIYPGGVAKSSKWVNKGGKIKNKPTVNAKVYQANVGKDRDKDGIVCEN